MSPRHMRWTVAAYIGSVLLLQPIRTPAQICSGLSYSVDGVSSNPLPPLSNITIKNTATQVAIEWDTPNAPSDSRVVWGTTYDYGSSDADPTLRTHHSMTLWNVAPGTTYRFRIFSRGSTYPGSFATRGDLVQVTGSSASFVEGVGAVVTWTTTSPVAGSVLYGVTSDLGQVFAETTATTSHRVVLASLPVNTAFFFRIVSGAAYLDGSFTTGACSPPMSACSNGCVLLAEDNGNCGACGNACSYGTTCRGGACVGCGELCTACTGVGASCSCSPLTPNGVAYECGQPAAGALFRVRRGDYRICTFSQGEATGAVSGGAQYEGIVGYAVPASTPGGVPLYRYDVEWTDGGTPYYSLSTDDQYLSSLGEYADSGAGFFAYYRWPSPVAYVLNSSGPGRIPLYQSVYQYDYTGSTAFGLVLDSFCSNSMAEAIGNPPYWYQGDLGFLGSSPQ